MGAKVRLPKRFIDQLEPKVAHYIVWDDDVSRFGVRVTTTGTKTFVIDYTTAVGRRRRQTIGRVGINTLDQARDAARRLLGSVLDGVDPIEAKQKARAEDTVKAFAREYLAYAELHKKPATVRADTYALDEVIVPKLGGLKLTAVTRRGVMDIHRAQADHPAQANRIVATFRHFYTVAAMMDRVPQGFNPCVQVVKYPEAERKRFLSGEELTRLGKVLKNLEPEHPYKVRAVRLLLLTGCRLNEILALRWDDVDIDGAVLHLRDAKAGPRDVPLGGPAIALLTAAERDSDWVIPSRSRKGRHLINLSTFWHNNVTTAAKLEGVRLHDLRHTVGSVGAGAGLSMLLIGNVLGHKQASTTERYSHVARGPQHEAADRISGEIAAALDGKTAKVVRMPARRRK